MPFDLAAQFMRASKSSAGLAGSVAGMYKDLRHVERAMKSGLFRRFAVDANAIQKSLAMAKKEGAFLMIGAQAGKTAEIVARLKDKFSGLGNVLRKVQSIGSGVFSFATGAAVAGAAALGAPSHFRLLTDSLKIFAASVGQYLGPALFQASEWLQRIGHWIRNLTPAQQENIKGWVVWGAKILVVVGALKILIPIIGTLIPLLGGLALPVLALAAAWALVLYNMQRANAEMRKAVDEEPTITEKDVAGSGLRQRLDAMAPEDRFAAADSEMKAALKTMSTAGQNADPAFFRDSKAAAKIALYEMRRLKGDQAGADALLGKGIMGGGKPKPGFRMLFPRDPNAPDASFGSIENARKQIMLRALNIAPPDQLLLDIARKDHVLMQQQQGVLAEIRDRLPIMGQ